ncbi:MAG: dihydropyrimidinase [Elusimicrobia bacterium]|nr:dihydropyrimidinase [Elusimicrobiota bacterium]
MSQNLLIKGGKIVLENSIQSADILIKNGRIADIIKKTDAIKPNPKNLKILNAKGLIVLPGIIDPHVHYNLHLEKGQTTGDDFLSGSAAAITGGVTTVIDYTGQKPGHNLKKGLFNRLKEAKNKMYTDYSFHSIIPSWKKLKNPEAQMKELIKSGAPSFKMFMAYESRGLMSDDTDLLNAFIAAKKEKALICLHAESGKAIDLLAAKYNNKKHSAIAAHYLSRPDYTEWEAVQTAIVWAKTAKAPVYFVHLSSGHSAQIIKKESKEFRYILGETCPQYLILEHKTLDDRNGYLFTSCPPIRTKKDSEILWKNLKNGTLQVIATDNCTFSKTQKKLYSKDRTKMRMGLPGSATLLPLIYTHGVKRGKITLIQLSKLMSLNPAKIMGLYPRKGIIKKGADADFAIIDPKKVKKTDFKNLKHNCDWSPYQGMKLYGFPKYTILRGIIAAKDGELISPLKPSGKFIKRKISA